MRAAELLLEALTLWNRGARLGVWGPFADRLGADARVSLDDRPRTVLEAVTWAREHAQPLVLRRMTVDTRGRAEARVGPPSDPVATTHVLCVSAVDERLDRFELRAVRPLDAVVRDVDVRLSIARLRDASDVDRLIRGLAETQWEHVPEDMAGHIARFLAGPSDSMILLAREGGRAVGVLVCIVAPAVCDGGTQVVIDDVFVEPSARGRGLGSALMEAAHAVADAREARVIYLHSLTGNAAAHRLYRRLGYAAEDAFVFQRATGDRSET